MKEQPSFTPGPWKDTFGEFHVDHVIEAGDEWVANAFRNAANARLIAAAPDIHAALAALADWSGCDHGRKPECIHWRAARAALAAVSA